MKYDLEFVCGIYYLIVSMSLSSVFVPLSVSTGIGIEMCVNV